MKYVNLYVCSILVTTLLSSCSALSLKKASENDEVSSEVFGIAFDIAGGNDQFALPKSTYAKKITVSATDKVTGQPISGLVVNFSLIDTHITGAQISQSSVATDATGRAETAVQAPTEYGQKFRVKAALDKTSLEKEFTLNTYPNEDCKIMRARIHSDSVAATQLDAATGYLDNDITTIDKYIGQVYAGDGVKLTLECYDKADNLVRDYNKTRNIKLSTTGGRSWTGKKAQYSSDGTTWADYKTISEDTKIDSNEFTISCTFVNGVCNTKPVLKWMHETHDATLNKGLRAYPGTPPLPSIKVSPETDGIIATGGMDILVNVRIKNTGRKLAFADMLGSPVVAGSVHLGNAPSFSFAATPAKTFYPAIVDSAGNWVSNVTASTLTKTDSSILPTDGDAINANVFNGTMLADSGQTFVFTPNRSGVVGLTISSASADSETMTWNITHGDLHHVDSYLVRHNETGDLSSSVAGHATGRTLASTTTVSSFQSTGTSTGMSAGEENKFRIILRDVNNNIITSENGTKGMTLSFSSAVGSEVITDAKTSRNEGRPIVSLAAGIINLSSSLTTPITVAFERGISKDTEKLILNDGTDVTNAAVTVATTGATSATFNTKVIVGSAVGINLHEQNPQSAYPTFDGSKPLFTNGPLTLATYDIGTYKTSEPKTYYLVTEDKGGNIITAQQSANWTDSDVWEDNWKNDAGNNDPTNSSKVTFTPFAAGSPGKVEITGVGGLLPTYTLTGRTDYDSIHHYILTAYKTPSSTANQVNATEKFYIEVKAVDINGNIITNNNNTISGFTFTHSDCDATSPAPILKAKEATVSSSLKFNAGIAKLGYENSSSVLLFPKAEVCSVEFSTVDSGVTHTGTLSLNILPGILQGANFSFSRYNSQDCTGASTNFTLNNTLTDTATDLTTDKCDQVVVSGTDVYGNNVAGSNQSWSNIITDGININATQSNENSTTPTYKIKYNKEGKTKIIADIGLGVNNPNVFVNVKTGKIASITFANTDPLNLTAGAAGSYVINGYDADNNLAKESTVDPTSEVLKYSSGTSLQSKDYFGTTRTHTTACGAFSSGSSTCTPVIYLDRDNSNNLKLTATTGTDTLTTSNSKLLTVSATTHNFWIPTRTNLTMDSIKSRFTDTSTEKCTSAESTDGDWAVETITAQSNGSGTNSFSYNIRSADTYGNLRTDYTGSAPVVTGSVATADWVNGSRTIKPYSGSSTVESTWTSGNSTMTIRENKAGKVYLSCTSQYCLRPWVGFSSCATYGVKLKDRNSVNLTSTIPTNAIVGDSYRLTPNVVDTIGNSDNVAQVKSISTTNYGGLCATPSNSETDPSTFDSTNCPGNSATGAVTINFSATYKNYVNLRFAKPATNKVLTVTVYDPSNPGQNYTGTVTVNSISVGTTALTNLLYCGTTPTLDYRGNITGTLCSAYGPIHIGDNFNVFHLARDWGQNLLDFTDIDTSYASNRESKNISSWPDVSIIQTDVRTANFKGFVVSLVQLAGMDNSTNLFNPTTNRFIYRLKSIANGGTANADITVDPNTAVSMFKLSEVDSPYTLTNSSKKLLVTFDSGSVEYLLPTGTRTITGSSAIIRYLASGFTPSITFSGSVSPSANTCNGSTNPCAITVQGSTQTLSSVSGGMSYSNVLNLTSGTP